MQAKVWYLTAVKHYPLYGYAQFPVTYKGFWSHPNTLILAVGADGVKFVNQKTKVVRERERERERDHYDEQPILLFFSLLSRYWLSMITVSWTLLPLILLKMP